MANNPFSKENIEEYNKMPKTKDPTGILPDDSYESGRDIEGEKDLKKRLSSNSRYKEYR